MTVQSTFSTTRTRGIAGQKVGNVAGSVETMRNDEATAAIAFGVAVQQASTTDPLSATLLTASTGELIAGILMHSNSYTDTQLDDDGVLPDALLNVVRQGRLLVLCEDGCSVGDPLHVRAVATGAELAGALLAAADGTDTIDCSAKGEWRTSAAAGELAELEFDFTGVDVAFSEIQISNDNASLTADLTVVLDAPTRRFRVDGARYYNATGLAVDPTDFFNIKVLIGATVAANWSTETSVGEGVIPAATFVSLTNAALADRLGAADDVISVVYDEDGTATLPAGLIVIDISYY